MNNTYPSKTIKAITDFLFIGLDKESLKPSDLVLVLGNDYIDGTMKVVNELFRDGIIKENAKIILSGATGTLNAGKEPECDRLYISAVEKFGMPPEIFVKENRATNAYLNFLYSKELIHNLLGGFDSYQQILCIGKAFLLRRASMYAAKLEYPERKIQYFGTVDIEGRNIGKDTWWTNEIAIKRVLAEVKRIGEYGMSGDLSIF